MQRLVLSGVLLVGACGVSDDRPATLDYITNAILAPTCALAECHSSFKREVGDQFDTVEATRFSIVAYSLVSPQTPDASTLYQSITVGTKSRNSNDKVRMPYDSPMPDADVKLILRWITDGAPGAQCIANAEGNGCAVNPDGATTRVVKCVDGNAGETVTLCLPTQLCAFTVENGKCVG